MPRAARPSLAPATSARTPATKQTDVLSAALDEFFAAGYVGASMDAIALAAGVSKPTLYRYFDTKEQLFLAAVRADLTARYDTLPAIRSWDGAAEARMRIRTFLRSWSRLLLDEETLRLRRLVIGEHARFPELTMLWSSINADRGDAPLRSALDRLQSEGVLDLGRRPDVALRQLIGMVIGAPQLVATFHGDVVTAVQRNTYVDSGLEMFWSHHLTHATEDGRT